MEECNILPKVAVLMSSYNGELYIKEQIESILNQKGVDVHLYIRDDGSSDKTESIIQNYTNRKNVFFKKGKRNLGPGKSFMQLLYAVGKKGGYQYYAFADQDDVWLEKKLVSAVNMLNNDEKPQLYCSNQIIYEDGQEKGVRFKEVPDLTLIGHMTRSEVYGCTMVLNSKLVEEIIRHKCPGCDILDLRLHDAFVFLVALLVGEVKYDEISYIRYRIHHDNVVGVKKKTIFDRVRRAVKRGLPYKNLRMKTAQFLLGNYEINDGEERKIIEEFANYQRNLKSRLKLMGDKRLCQVSGENRWGFVIKVLINYV